MGYNFFYNFEPYALSTRNQKYASKMHHIWRALRIRVEKFKHNLHENYPKGTKIAITTCKFSKIFWGSMPPDLPRGFLVS